MALDMDQLRRIFYEECRENLEILERELLALDPDADVDLDIINTIFRAAHSIKGGGLLLISMKSVSLPMSWRHCLMKPEKENVASMPAP